MPPTTANFSFICGADDFLVTRAGKDRWETLVAEAGADEYGREVISGFAANFSEVETAINRFRESVQTVSMFGGKRVVWLKDVNFLADSVTGRAEGTLKIIEDLQALLSSINPAEVGVLITAAPVDRRRSFAKWCEKNSDFLLAGGDGGNAHDAMISIILTEARAISTKIDPDAAELLLAKIGPNTRLLVEEVRKLSLFAGEGLPIKEEHVAELSPNVAEGDFFEAAEYFFQGKIPPTIDAVHRHFFSGGDARPLLSSLQNRNRILIQVRALIDSEEVKLGSRGLDGLQKAATTHGARFGSALSEKSPYNIFSQNAWYVGKLAQSGNLPTLRKLIDNQREFISTFEGLIGCDDQEELLRAMVVRCLSSS